MKVKNNKGFTLAELLIVMAIVVVLASVAVPTFGRQMETSRETADMEVVRNCYEEVLTMVTRDALDGKLDGKDDTVTLSSTTTETTDNTDPGNPVTTTTTTVGVYPGIEWSATTAGNTAQGTYTVTLANLASHPKMSQGTSGWQYVKGKLFGADVPNITYETTKLIFKFEIASEATTAGNLKLIDTNPITAATD